MKAYFLEKTIGGVLQALPHITDDSEAVKFADSLGENYCNDDDAVTTGCVIKQEDGGENIVLCPGGPGGENYTWVPASQL